MNNRKAPRIRFKGFTDDWEQRKLDEISDRYDNLRIPVAASLRISGPIPYYGANGIQDYVEGYTHEGEFVLVAEDGANDLKNYPVKCVKGRIWVNNHAHVLQAKSCIADNYFLAFSLNRADIESLLVGGGRAKLNAETMMNISLMFPSITEQREIGKYILSIDHLITLHQRKLEKLKIVKKAMLENCFPKNGEKVPKFRFSGFTGDWEQRKLLDLIIEYKETVDSDCNLPILTSSKTEGVVLQEDHFGRVQNHDITGYNILPRNYCTYRNRSDGVDFTFNINRCCDKGIISKFYPVFYGNNSDIFFISMVLNYCDEVMHEIAYTCTGTGQKVLSFLDLQKMNIRVASYDEQKKISQYFEQLDHLITLHQRKLEKLKIIKKSFLEKMFV